MNTEYTEDHDEPKVGDPVWIAYHNAPNGTIVQIDEEQDSVLVIDSLGIMVELTYSAFSDAWSEQYSGLWMIHEA